MKALVYQGTGKKTLEERPKPAIKVPTDAIVKITNTTICGTDLHVLKGDVPTCQPGRILGHEGVGVIDSVGVAVTAFKPGDRMLISCITACGKCTYCRKQMYSRCTTGGWILGNGIDGTQAELVLIPHADTSLYRILDGADQEALVMLIWGLQRPSACSCRCGSQVSRRETTPTPSSLSLDLDDDL